MSDPIIIIYGKAKGLPHTVSWDELAGAFEDDIDFDLQDDYYVRKPGRTTCVCGYHFVPCPCCVAKQKEAGGNGAYCSEACRVDCESDVVWCMPELVDQMRSHYDVCPLKPIECEVCGASVERHALDLHVENECPCCACDLCQETFTRRSHLQQHQDNISHCANSIRCRNLCIRSDYPKDFVPNQQELQREWDAAFPDGQHRYIKKSDMMMHVTHQCPRRKQIVPATSASDCKYRKRQRFT